MEATTAPKMVPGYRHVPGNHCGSTALRNLLAFHGAEISEEMALGLGAGVSFYYVALDGQSPSRFTNGRVGRLEEQFVELTGGADPPRDLRRSRGLVGGGAGRGRRQAVRPSCSPTSTTSTTTEPRPTSPVTPWSSPATTPRSPTSPTPRSRSCRRRASTNLAQARHGKHPVFPLDGHMFTVPEGAELGDVREASARAIERNAKRMLDPPLGDYEGLPALRRFAAEVGDWPEQVEDWRWCARFCYQVIERRGTGGGNFRLMYSRFLEEAGSEDAPLAADAAASWTALAEALLAASEADGPEPEPVVADPRRGGRGAGCRGAPVAGARRIAAFDPAFASADPDHRLAIQRVRLKRAK